MAGELLSATPNEQIESITRSTLEIEPHHLILGGRSGTGLGLALHLAGKGESVLFTHSGSLKQSRVDGTLAQVRQAFVESGASGDSKVEVVMIGGDATTAEHRNQILRATSLWLPENASLTSLSLMAARGVPITKPGDEVQEPDPDFARKLNVDGVIGVLEKLYDAETADGKSFLHGAAALYPASTASHVWGEGIDTEQFELYGAVGPTKHEAEQLIQGPWRKKLSWVDGRGITVVLGKVDETMVDKQIQRKAPQYLERPDVIATNISAAKAGKGMAEIIADPEKYPNGSVVHILRDKIVVEAVEVAAGGAQ